MKANIIFDYNSKIINNINIQLKEKQEIYTKLYYDKYNNNYKSTTLI